MRNRLEARENASDLSANDFGLASDWFSMLREISYKQTLNVET